MVEFYDEMLKDIRGDKLKDLEIPEGVDLDKSVVEKLKNIGDEGKQFLKSILGFEDTTADLDERPKPRADQGEDEVIKALDEMKKDINDIKTENSELKKEVKTLQEENMGLKKDVGETRQSAAEKEHKTLVKKALDLTKKLDEETEIKNEKTLLETLEKELGKEEVEEDPDRCIKIYNRGIELALKNIPDGSIPHTTDVTIKKQADVDKKEAEDIRKEIEEMGTATE
jgi:hypothetical protein